MNPYLNFRFQRLISFQGRASRTEFWVIVAAIAAYWYILHLVLSDHLPKKSEDDQLGNISVLGAAAMVSMAMCASPLLAAVEKRTHDFGQTLRVIVGSFLVYIGIIILSGLWTAYDDPAAFQIFEFVSSEPNTIMKLAALAAFIAIALILSRPSDPKSNQYGPNPNEVPQ